MSYNPYMNNILVISGKQYSGKDTLAKILLEKMNGFKRVGIGDAIKIEYGKQKNLSFEQIEKDKHLYRSDLIELGDWGRAQDPNYWLKKISDMDKIIVPDIRVEFEANFFKEKGAFLIRVDSSVENRSKRGVLVRADDPTETALDNYKNWDMIIENNSTYEALNQKADKVIEKFNSFIGSKSV